MASAKRFRFNRSGRFRLIGGDDLYVEKIGRHGIFRNVILEHQFILELRGLRHDKILPVCGELGFCAVTSSGAMVPISNCFLLSLNSFSETVTACFSTLTFSRAYTNSQYAVMVFVTVVMACCAKARSAILRLFSVMMMLRRLTKRPAPARSCCWKPIVREDCTYGLKKFAAVEEERVLSHATLRARR